MKNHKVAAWRKSLDEDKIRRSTWRFAANAFTTDSIEIIDGSILAVISEKLLPFADRIGISLGMIELCSTAAPSHANFRPRSTATRLRIAGVGLLALTLSACASMPASGPTVEQLHKNSATPGNDGLSFTLVNLDARTVGQSDPPQSIGVLGLAALSSDSVSERTDLIRSGDTLAISVFEVGVSLFSGTAGPSALAVDPTRTPAASTQTFTVQVREDGTIDLPYVGAIRAAGNYPEVLAAAIGAHLRGLSESPSVTVNIADSLRNVVYVGGAVSRAGRYRLTAARERLLDILALAGGSPIDVNDLQVTFVRGDHTIAAPLNQIEAGDLANLPLKPGDRITLERVRQSYTVFGATDRVSQVPFDAKTVSLAEALARAGGPSDWRANPRGVYLFRLERGGDGKQRAMVYQLNMLKPQTYFFAQMFPMRDKDVILFANSSANLTQKLFSLFSQLFNPVVAVRTATH